MDSLSLVVRPFQKIARCSPENISARNLAYPFSIV